MAMIKPIRRVVTGHDEKGTAVVLMDGAAPNVKVRSSGIVSTVAWATEEMPVNISGADDRAARDGGTAPSPNGSILRIVDFPPLGAEGAEALDQATILREMGLGHDGHAPARHPFMHRTRSIDYAIVLSGEIDMLLDDSEVHLQAGDIVVQQGTNHAWVNNGKETCRIVFVLMDAEEPAAWKKK